MSDKTVCGVLTEARSLVEQGWMRGAYFRAGRYCADGAIGTAVLQVLGSGYPGFDPLYGAAYKALQQAAGLAPGDSIHIWNDEQTSKRPVLAAFAKAIKACK